MSCDLGLSLHSRFVYEVNKQLKSMAYLFYERIRLCDFMVACLRGYEEMASNFRRQIPWSQCSKRN